MKTIFKSAFCRYILLILSFLLFFALLFTSEFAKNGALTGLKLWLYTILPTLFPFIFITEIIKGIGGIPVLSKLVHPFTFPVKLSKNGTYPLVLGLLCGFPMGAKAVSDMIKEDKITKKEGAFLLTFSNMLSPGFIAGYYCQNVLKNSFDKFVVLGIIYLSQLVVCAIYKLICYNKINFNELHTSNTPVSIRKNTVTLDTVITNTFSSVFKIAGYIIIFSIICEYIKMLPLNSCFSASLTAITEITTGLNMLSTSDISQSLKFIIGNAALSFGGLSGIFQTMAMTRTTGIKIKSYIVSRIIAALITVILSVLYLYWIKNN